MHTTSESATRELDSRTSDGIDVRLLWDSRTNRVSVAVDDVRNCHSFEFEVDGADALAALHHPYAYLTRATPATCWVRECNNTGERS
jgi:hypothetical protein